MILFCGSSNSPKRNKNNADIWNNEIFLDDSVATHSYETDAITDLFCKLKNI